MDSEKHNSDSSEDECNEMLLAAVRKKNIEEVERLLQNPNINLNYDIGDGSTVFFESLFMEDYDIFLRLIDAGYDINLANDHQETPLQIAVVYSPASFVGELIRRGAYINAKQHMLTPLHYAAAYDNVEVVCTLLYYGADANARCSNNMTPLMFALQEIAVEAPKLLFNYYDDFSCASDVGCKALDYAALHGHPLVVDILRACKDEEEYSYGLLLSLENENSKLFKLIWSEFHKQIRLNDEFLVAFFSTCQFSNHEWLDCLHLLLKSSTAFELLQQNKNNYVVKLQERKFLWKLLVTLDKRNLELNDRLPTIYLFLSFGIEITAEVVNLAYLLFGFNEELEALMYGLNYAQPIKLCDLLTLPKFIFDLEDVYENIGVAQIFEFLCSAENIKLFVMSRRQNIITDSLGFFSLSFSQKQEMLELCQKYLRDYQCITKKLNAIPELPSLLELSRNGARKFIRQIYNVKKSYKFHDAVKHLNLPQCITDIIRFKTPVY